jgi:hypothetical protein
MSLKQKLAAAEQLLKEAYELIDLQELEVERLRAADLGIAPSPSSTQRMISGRPIRVAAATPLLRFRGAPDLLDTLVAPAVPAVKFVAHWVLVSKVLVILLGRPEPFGVGDLDGDRLLYELRHLGLLPFGNLSLFFVRHKNYRAIGGPAVVQRQFFSPQESSYTGTRA